jgi:hypothetical protein
LLLVGLVFSVAFVWLARMTKPASVERFLAGNVEAHAVAGDGLVGRRR